MYASCSNPLALALFCSHTLTLTPFASRDLLSLCMQAVLSIWSSSTHGESLEALTHRAVACGLEQMRRLHNWDTKEGIMYLSTSTRTRLEMVTKLSALFRLIHLTLGFHVTLQVAATPRLGCWSRARHRFRKLLEGVVAGIGARFTKVRSA